MKQDDKNNEAVDGYTSPAIQKSNRPPVSCETIALAEQAIIKIRSTLKNSHIKTRQDILDAQTLELHWLFEAMLAQSLDTKNTDALGIVLGLRAQKQCRNTIETLEQVEAFSKYRKKPSNKLENYE